MRHPRLARVLLVCLLMIGLTGCSFEDFDLIEEILWEWTSQKNLNPRNAEGQIDPLKAAGAAVEVGKREVTGSTGDKEADGALGIGEAIESLRPWDKEVNSAIDTGDETKIHEAIVLYEDDFHYRNALGVVQMSQGKLDAAMSTFADATSTYQRANPKSSSGQGERVILRDQLSLLDRVIKNEDKNGTTEAGRLRLKQQYCQQARSLQKNSGDSFWLNRAKGALGFSCDEY